MKTNFKFFSMAALALAVGFTSCSDSDDDGPGIDDGLKKVKVQINLGNTTSRATAPDAESANNKPPAFADLKLIFVGEGIVQSVQDVTSDEDKTEIKDQTDGKTFTVPKATTTVYAIGNVNSTTGVGSPTTFPVKGNAESTVTGLMLDLEAQQSYSIVNLSQGQGELGAAGAGKDFASDEVSFEIYPAVARYEIKKIKIDPSATKPLESFQLGGIFITNTYLKLGLDYATLPSTSTDIINFGPGTAGFEANIPAKLKDDETSSLRGATTEFTPIDGAGYFWHYFVMPPIANKGTTLYGNAEGESSIPMIVLKIMNAEAPTGGPTYDPVQYVNVRRLLNNGTGKEITYLEPGKVYLINEILFGGEHLTENPGENHEKSVTVKVTVKNWEGVNVTPIL